MKLVVFSLFAIAVVAVVDPSYRIYLIVLPLVILAYLSARNPIKGLWVVIVSLGFPIFVQVMGRDAFVLSTALIVVMYIVALAKRQLASPTGLLTPAFLIVVLYGFNLTSLPSTDMLLTASRQFLGLVASFMLFHLVISVTRTRSQSMTLVSALLVLTASQAALAIAQTAFPDQQPAVLSLFAARTGFVGADYVGGLNRARGTIGDYELLSEWLCGATFVALGLRYSRNLLLRILAPALTVLYVGGMVATGSRGGILAAGVGFLAYVILLARRSMKHAVRTCVFAVFGAALASTLVLWVLPTAGSGLIDRFQEASANIDSTTTVYAGQSLFESVASALNRGNWLRQPSFVTDATIIGHGFFSLEYLDYQGAGSLHALWLTLWFQCGIVGIACWGWFAMAAILAIRRQWSRTDLSYSVLFVSLLAGLIAMLADETKVEFLRQQYLMQFFLFFVGLVLAVSKLMSDENEQGSVGHCVAELPHFQPYYHKRQQMP